MNGQIGNKPRPKYWINKMISLFGFSDQSYYENAAPELGDVERPKSSDLRRTIPVTGPIVLFNYFFSRSIFSEIFILYQVHIWAD
jgi:hypothetical protein